MTFLEVIGAVYAIAILIGLVTIPLTIIWSLLHGEK